MYFALFTIGLAEVGRAIVEAARGARQEQGLYGAARFLKEDQIATENGRTIHFFVGLALIVFCLIVYRLVDGGRLGLLLRTARESEGVAKGLGIDVVRARFAVFIISSAVLGLIGGFYTGYYGGVSLTIFDFNTLLLLLAMIVVGGLGSAKGAIIGTALLLYIDRTYADFDTPAWRFVWIGIIMFGVTLLTTRGPRRAAGSDPRLRAAAPGAANDRRGASRCRPRPSSKSPGCRPWASTAASRGGARAGRLAPGRARRGAVRRVRIESVNPKYPGQVYDEVVGGEGEVGKFVGEIYRAIGCEVDLFAVEPGRENAVGVLKGAGGGRSLIYNGHVDVVPPGDPANWKSGSPFSGKIDGDRVWGRGSTDMKRGSWRRPSRRARSSRAA